MTNATQTDPIRGDILVVDDVPANLTLLTGMLKEKGYRVRPVPSGKPALKAVEDEAISWFIEWLWDCVVGLVPPRNDKWGVLQKS